MFSFVGQFKVNQRVALQPLTPQSLIYPSVSSRWVMIWVIYPELKGKPHLLYCNKNSPTPFSVSDTVI